MNAPLLAPIVAGRTYRTRSGYLAKVERISGYRIFGTIFKGQVQVEWDLSGRRIPVGGEDPNDLVL